MRSDSHAKRDCFAYTYRKKIVGGISQMVHGCKVCKEAYCVDGRCPFYKNKDEWENQLIQLHGTYNLNKIFRDYEVRKKGESKR